MDILDYSTIDMCRLCERTNNLSKIFSKENKHIINKIRACADVTVELNDLLPKFICKICEDKLEYSYKFKIQCEYTDRKIRDAIDEAEKKLNENATRECARNVNINDYNIELDTNNIIEEYVLNETEEDDSSVVMDNQIIMQIDDLSTESYDENDNSNLELQKTLENDDEEHRTITNLSNYSELNEIFDENIKIENSNESVIIDEIVLKETNEYDDSEIIEYESIDGEIIFENSEDNSQEANNEIIEENTEYETSYKCDICEIVFDTKELMKNHKKRHTSKIHQCDLCQKVFSKNIHLKNHIISHSGEKGYKCDKCYKQYTNLGNLERHIRVFHNKERPFICNICGKGFSQTSTLKQHQSVHIEERQFQCDVCYKSFKTLRDLDLHKDRHLPKDQRKFKIYPHKKPKTPAPIKECICTVCGKKSNTVALHQSHIRTHTGEKPYECPVCHKKFSFQQSLKAHILLHTGEKPFKCDICGLSFRQIGHLKGHKLVHTGEKSHQCMVCNKLFALRCNLTVHMRLHTGETPYQCNICNKKFYDSNAMQRHKVVHTKKNKNEIEGEQRTESIIKLAGVPDIQNSTNDIVKLENIKMESIQYDEIIDDATKDTIS